MVKRWVFAGAIVGVLSLMGYGVYEAFSGSGAEAYAAGDRGRWTTESDGPVGGEGAGQGRGRAPLAEAPHTGRSGGGRGSGSTGPQAAPLAETDHVWTEAAGSVVSLDDSQLVLQRPDGSLLTAGLGQSGYWASLGIVLQPGDEVQLTGFAEDGDLEVQSLTLPATGQTVVLRDETGRPLWAGGGRWAAPAVRDSGSAL